MCPMQFPRGLEIIVVADLASIAFLASHGSVDNAPSPQHAGPGCDTVWQDRRAATKAEEIL